MPMSAMGALYPGGRVPSGLDLRFCAIAPRRFWRMADLFLNCRMSQLSARSSNAPRFFFVVQTGAVSNAGRCRRKNGLGTSLRTKG